MVMSDHSRFAMKNVTLRAEEHLIEAARKRALDENSTLNRQFRRWLAEYTHSRERLSRYDEAMATLRGKLQVGRKLTRDETNER
jgi:hypothetical protein